MRLTRAVTAAVLSLLFALTMPSPATAMSVNDWGALYKTLDKVRALTPPQDFTPSDDASFTRKLRSARGEVKQAWAEIARGSVAGNVDLADNGCPSSTIPGTTPDGLPKGMNILQTCTAALNNAPDKIAQRAILFAFLNLGADYACKGTGRENPWRFDCSSFVSRAYEAAGVRVRVDGTWSPNTSYMLSSTQDTFLPVRPNRARPGDLALYYTCPTVNCDYNHVVMWLGDIGGDAWMIHTNACDSPAKIERFWGFQDNAHGDFLGARTVARP